MAHKFVRLFADSIKAYRMIDIIACRKRHCLIQTVNARTAGIGKMFRMIMAAGFQNVDKTDDIAVNVSVLLVILRFIYCIVSFSRYTWWEIGNRGIARNNLRKANCQNLRPRIIKGRGIKCIALYA